MYRITTQRQVRKAFWTEYQHIEGISKRKIPNYAGNGTMHNTDTRCAFSDFVDMLSRESIISHELAHRVTLD